MRRKDEINQSHIKVNKLGNEDNKSEHNMPSFEEMMKKNLIDRVVDIKENKLEQELIMINLAEVQSS